MRRLIACGRLLVLAAAVGCSGTPAPPKTVAAALKVTLADGQPLRAGEVRLVPQRGVAVPNREVQAVGRPAGDGTYALTTFSPQDGAVPGNYLVVVRGGGRAVPARFQDEDTSDLKITIPPGGGTLELHLAR
jgi:hypothetical protein